VAAAAGGAPRLVVAAALPRVERTGLPEPGEGEGVVPVLTALGRRYFLRRTGEADCYLYDEVLEGPFLARLSQPLPPGR
jgi:hypothetical protein